MLCSHFAALSFSLLLYLFLAGLENSQASKRYVMPARTGDTSLKLTFLNCQHLTCSPSLSLPAPLSLSIRTLSLPLPFCILTLTLGSRSLSLLLLLLPLLTCPAGWLVCPTSLTASPNPDPGQWAGWTCLTSSTQHAARKAQRAIVSVKRVATATKTAMKCTYTHSTKYICTHACTQNIFVCVIYIFRCCCSCHVGVAINKPTLLCGMLCDARVSQTKASYS